MTGSTASRPAPALAGGLAERLDALGELHWRRCPGCGTGLYKPRLAQHLETCPSCGHHFRLTAAQRIEQLADPGSFTEAHQGLAAEDPLGFVDSVGYPDRLARFRHRTGLRDAAVCGTATLGGHPVVLCVLDFAFLAGSMGSVVGEKVTRSAETARRTGAPLIVCATSGGARMQEGVVALLQMAKTSAALAALRRAGVPYFSVLADPVYGGVTASFASLGDVILAEPGARAGFAGPQVIEQTIRQKLPAGFQTAEFLLEHGHIDGVVPRKELRTTLMRLVAAHAAAGTWRRHGGPEAPSDGPVGAVRDAWETVQLARDPARPHVGEYAELAFDSFLELRGDRWSEDDPSVVGGVATVDGLPFVLLGHRKGRGTKEGVARNFGMPHPSGYRKALRLMRYADAFGLPVVTLIDTPGAYPGIRAEEENQSRAIAENLAEMAGLRVPVVSVVIGEGGSGGALALGVGDRLLMLANTTYSIISPEGCATILFGDAGRAGDAARALRLTAADLYELGLVDAVLPEPAGGAHADHAAVAGTVRRAVVGSLAELSRLPVDELLARRAARLRGYGRITDIAGAAGDGRNQAGVPAGLEEVRA